MAIKQPNIAPFDADAQRFILAAGLSRYVDKRAINYLVQGLKANNLWVKCAAIYPFVGGNVWSVKFNLKDPRDISTSFRLTFIANPTITYNGIDWNGSTQYANTNLIPSTTSPISLNSSHISYYSRENIQEAAFDMGSTDTTTGYTYLNIRSTDNTTRASNNVVSTDLFTIANTDARGFYINSRVNATQIMCTKNGVTTTGSFNSFNIPNLAMFLGCRNFLGNPTNFSSKQCAFCSIGSGLTAAEALIFYNIVQQFQIILQRNV